MNIWEIVTLNDLIKVDRADILIYETQIEDIDRQIKQNEGDARTHKGKTEETSFFKDVVLIKHQLGFFVATSKGADGGKLFKRRSRRECGPVS